MDKVAKFSPDAGKNMLLSSLLCFVTGFLYALGVFNTSVEEAASPPGSLDGVWSGGMALLSAFSVPSMFFCGIYLSEESSSVYGIGDTRSMTGRVRLVAALGSLSYAAFCTGAYGVSISNAFLIQLSFASIGIGFGFFYLLALELLAVWVPQKPGLAVGFGQMMFGFGSIIGSSVFSSFLQNHSAANSLYLVTLIFAIPTIGATPFLQWPEPESSDSYNAGEAEALLQKAAPLTVMELLCKLAFWGYFLSIFSLQAGYAFIAYYFKIGQTFGKGMTHVVTTFQVGTIVATLSRPLCGALVDMMKTKGGFFSLGSKNVILGLLSCQIVSFVALISVSRNGSYEGYAFFAGVVMTIFAAGACCPPLLARELFGSVNSSVVFGTGGSISMGMGEIAAVMAMTAVEGSSMKIGVPEAYEGYYVISALWSLLGIVACFWLKPREEKVVEIGEHVPDIMAELC